MGMSVKPRVARSALRRCAFRVIVVERSSRPCAIAVLRVVPEDFAPQIKRLETRLKTHEEGTIAVEQALDGLLGDLTGKAP